MVDARDIAEVAAIELIRRDRAPGKLPIETINLVVPTRSLARTRRRFGRRCWAARSPTAATIRPVEANMATFMPKWMAYEMRVMAERYVSDGMIPEAGDRARLTDILGARCTPTAPSPARLSPRGRRPLSTRLPRGDPIGPARLRLAPNPCASVLVRCHGRPMAAPPLTRPETVGLLITLLKRSEALGCGVGSAARGHSGSAVCRHDERRRC